MIFILRLVIFSLLIWCGFCISIKSVKGRAAVSVIYGFVLIFYTFLIRVRFIVDVSASDYGHAIITQRSVGEKVLQLLQAIFGMQANGNLAGNYREAFVLNVLLIIPLGYLVLLHFLCGDSSLSYAVKDKISSVAITEGREKSEKRTLAKTALRTEIICIATSFAIEVTQEITTLGMFDINDLLANSIGGCVGIFLVISYVRQHFRRSEW